MALPSPRPSPRHGRFHRTETQPPLPGDEGITGADQLQRPPGIRNTKPSPPFIYLVRLFQKLRDCKAQDRKNILSNWFNLWRENVGNDLYPAMRLILPHKDRERATYGLKEANLARSYIAALGLEKNSADAVRLVKWKQPTRDTSVIVGDFPTVVYEVVNARSSVEQGTVTVDELNSFLDAMSMATREQGYTRIFSQLLDRCTPEEHRWIVRIILKVPSVIHVVTHTDLNISVKETTVLSVFHPDAMDMFNTCSDLKRICWILPSQEHRAPQNEMQIKLFQSFQPMLCKRSKSLQESVKAMGKREFIMEEKLDGERIQLHKRGNQFFYCSRKGKDYTYLYGSHVGEGALTPHIQDSFSSIVNDIILDGEMLVWDPSIEKYCSFGNLKTAALEAMRNVATDSDAPRPCYKIFDILYVSFDNGKEQLLTEIPLKNRKKLISSLITEVKGRFECATQEVGKTLQDVEKMLQVVVEARGEGLVLKTPDSRYIPGGRENCWMKVKPEYMDSMGESVDVLVVGGNWGKGKRGGKLSNLIAAVVDDSSGSKPGSGTRYSTFVRIGTGLSLSDYEWIKDKPWKRFDKKNPPPWLNLSSLVGSDDKGDMYIEPEDSFIISVKAASITATDQYACQMTMRFPRCSHIRTDLKIDEVLTFSELVAMAQGKRKSEDEDKVSAKKRRAGTGRVAPQLAGNSRGENVKDVIVKTDLFEDITFRIFADNKSRPPNDKASLERIVVEHGGTFTQAITPNIDNIVLVYGGTAKIAAIANIMFKDDMDIIKPLWIHDCIRKDHLVPPTKKYYFHATTARQQDDNFADNEDSDTEDEEEEEPGNDPERASTEATSTIKSDAEESEDELDETFAWVKLEPPVDMATENRLNAIRDNEESETEDEDDFEKISLPGGSIRSLDDEDEEAKVKDGHKNKKMEGLTRRVSEINVNGSDTEDEGDENPPKATSPDVEMGESEDAVEYDDVKIFKHLCFYLDSPANAIALGMNVKINSQLQAEITTELAQIEDLVVENGGRVVGNIAEPKLTHIIIHPEDISRRIDLMRKTALPKRRHMVTPDFIRESLEQDSLLNEDAYVP